MLRIEPLSPQLHQEARGGGGGFPDLKISRCDNRLPVRSAVTAGRSSPRRGAKNPRRQRRKNSACATGGGARAKGGQTTKTASFSIMMQISFPSRKRKCRRTGSGWRHRRIGRTTSRADRCQASPPCSIASTPPLLVLANASHIRNAFRRSGLGRAS